MALVLFTILLWTATATLGAIAFRRSDGTFARGLRDAAREAVFIAPRLCIGILGAGFVAALLPADLVSAYLGAGSGIVGLAGASVAGMILPGGPVVAFAVGAAALEAGAGHGQVGAFILGWLLLSSNRTLVWEIPIMGTGFVLFRMVLATPIPLAIGYFISLLAN
ncbi:hypothetical protein [Roseibium polysiphoniae]|uniref:hypothetical protein n=1 Tax=Roseibium polysiphoniae TaxID=2571221 RepID=UPI003298408F